MKLSKRYQSMANPICRHFGMSPISVVLNRRLKRILGRMAKVIELSPKADTLTLYHELAHYLQHYRFTWRIPGFYAVEYWPKIEPVSGYPASYAATGPKETVYFLRDYHGKTFKLCLQDIITRSRNKRSILKPVSPDREAGGEEEEKMSFRKFETHKEETRAVKKALDEAGIKASVSHGRGTAYGWLEVNLGPRAGKHMKAGEKGEVLYLTQEEAGKLDRYYPCLGDCPVCENARILRDRTMGIILEITGRHGEDRQILILEQ